MTAFLIFRHREQLLLILLKITYSILGPVPSRKKEDLKLGSRLAPAVFQVTFEIPSNAQKSLPLLRYVEVVESVICAKLNGEVLDVLVQFEETLVERPYNIIILFLKCFQKFY